MTNSISAESISVTIKKRPILQNVSFNLDTQKIIGLIGPSGSGKTTLMRSVVGLQRISNGRMIVLGSQPGNKALRPQIGYMSQVRSTYPDLTVKENMSYFSKIYNQPTRRVEELLEEVELQPQAHQLVSDLSGGQQARVSLAVALIAQPKLLVLDEPTVGLDPLLRQKLWQSFRKLADSGSTLLVSSHVMDEAYRCDELLLMHEGAILAQGTSSQLQAKTNSNSIEEAFIELVRGEK